MFTIITGSVVGLAFYGAAIIIAKLCDYAILLSNAVYPKLLEGNNKTMWDNLIDTKYFYRNEEHTVFRNMMEPPHQKSNQYHMDTDLSDYLYQILSINQ